MPARRIGFAWPQARLGSVTISSVPPPVRATVQAVRDLLKKKGVSVADKAGVRVAEVAEVLGVDKSTAWRRVQQAIDREFLKNLEDRPYRPAILTRGERLPEDTLVFPEPGEVARLHACRRGKAPLPPSPAVPAQKGAPR